MSLRAQAKKLKKNKVNTKWLMVELMKISPIDFTAEHMMFKLYKYGFTCDLNCSKWMYELCNDGELIFNGWKPERVNSRLIGYEPVFGLITQK